jgi:hypothetical protein
MKKFWETYPQQNNHAKPASLRTLPTRKGKNKCKQTKLYPWENRKLDSPIGKGRGRKRRGRGRRQDRGMRDSKKWPDPRRGRHRRRPRRRCRRARPPQRLHCCPVIPPLILLSSSINNKLFYRINSCKKRKMIKARYLLTWSWGYLREREEMARVAAARAVGPIAATTPFHLPRTKLHSEHRHLSNFYRFDLWFSTRTWVATIDPSSSHNFPRFSSRFATPLFSDH